MWLRGLREKRDPSMFCLVIYVLCRVRGRCLFGFKAHLRFDPNLLYLKLIGLSYYRLLIPAVLPLFSSTPGIIFNLIELLLRFIIHDLVLFLRHNLVRALMKVMRVCAHSLVMMACSEHP